MKAKIHLEKCHVCGYETTANLLARHIKCKHGQQEYIIYKKYLDDRMEKIKEEVHQKTLNNTKNKILSCPYCERKEVNIKNLKYHIKIQHEDNYTAFLQNLAIQNKIILENNKKQYLQKSSKNYICQYCNEVIPAKQFPHHLKFKHGEQAYLKFKIKYQNNKNEEKQKSKQPILCPYCGEKLYSLNKHIFYKHNKTIADFKQEFPNMRLQSHTRLETKINCEFCNKQFKYNNIYMLHLKQYHNEQYIRKKIQKEQQNKQKHFECSICHKKTNQLYQHVYQSHNNISWQQYCKTFSHNIEEKTYFSNEHRQKLSNAIIKNGVSIHPNKSYYFFINDEKYPKILRSLQQFKIITVLIQENIKFEYENTIIKWLDYNNFQHNYIVDLVINDNYYEIKGYSNKKIENIKKQEKYLKVNSILQKKNKILHFINLKQFLFQFKLNNKIYTQEFFIEKIKKLLKENKISIKYFLQKNIKHQPRLYKKLDKNYKTNKNLIIIG